MQATGLADGEYRLGDQTVTVTAGAARIPSGSLAGSTLTMDRAVRACVETGIPLPDALQMATATPAALLGIGEVTGRIAPGADADLVVLDETLAAVGTMVGGRWAHRDAILGPAAAAAR